MALARPPKAVDNDIHKPASKTDSVAADLYIQGAPDLEGRPKRLRRGKRVQVSHTLPEAMLDEIDAAAADDGLSRTAWINWQIKKILKKRDGKK
ncbi:hypothetical protein [Pseudomonas savastanoi]|uniref:Uncharacterized protein n=1 Tax=Pseudomonas savastanoi TaxID=29438 RepID=A0A3M6A777_PSESS|nr:hypothetical protein [Pseudomonas savastanoi]RMV05888.1 hypothetical protein ALP17_102408 [Pseudomonas savastanoi]RMV15129.1 hypothetical protein ALP15_100629 [Pseudomonas savastanoi]